MILAVKLRADHHAHDLVDVNAARAAWRKGEDDLDGPFRNMPPLIMFHKHQPEGDRDEDGYFPVPDYYSARRPLSDEEWYWYQHYVDNSMS